MIPETKKTFKNRKIHGLPKSECVIKIIVNNSEGEQTHLCKWNPITNEHGLLGTATTIDRKTNIGFNAWEQNDSEFIYYKINE